MEWYAGGVFQSTVVFAQVRYYYYLILRSDGFAHRTHGRNINHFGCISDSLGCLAAVSECMDSCISIKGADPEN